MKNINKSKKGLTLVELIVCVAILGIFLTAVYSFNLFTTKTFFNTSSKADKQNCIRMAEAFITKQVRYAKSVEILTTPPSPSEDYCDIYIDSGNIRYYKNGVLTDIPGIFNTSDYTLAFSKISDKILYFKVGKSDSNMYDLDTKVEIQNIEMDAPHKIQDVGSGTKIGIRFKIE